MSDDRQQGPPRWTPGTENGGEQYSLRAAYLWGQIGRLLEISANFAYSILVIRLLTPGDYGLYAIIWSVVNTTILLVSLGMEESITRFAQTLLHHSRGWLSRFQRRMIGERLLIGAVAGGVLYVTADLVGRWMNTPHLADSRWILAALLFFFSLWNLFSAVAVANLLLREHALVRLVNQLLNLVLASAGFYWIGRRVEVALWGMVVSFVVTNLLFLAILFRRGVVSAPPADEPLEIRPLRTYGLSLWLINLATYGLAAQIDVLLIAGLLASAEAVSFYNVPLLFLTKVITVFTGWQTVMVPATTRVFERHGLPGMRNLFALYVRLNLLLMLPLFAFVIGHARSLLVLLFDVAYSPAAPNMVAMSLFATASVLAAAHISQPFLYVLKRQNTVLAVRIVAGLVNIALNLLLIPRLGVMGAVVGTGASNLLIHVAELVLAFQARAARLPWEFMVKVTICSLGALLVSRLIPGDGWLNLVASATLFSAIFAAGGLALRLVQQEEMDLLSQMIPAVGQLRRLLATRGLKRG